MLLFTFTYLTYINYIKNEQNIASYRIRPHLPGYVLKIHLAIRGLIQNCTGDISTFVLFAFIA